MRFKSSVQLLARQEGVFLFFLVRKSKKASTRSRINFVEQEKELGSLSTEDSENSGATALTEPKKRG